jgi:hypothetical protein
MYTAKGVTMVSFTEPVKTEIRATARALKDAWTKGNPDDLFAIFHRRVEMI